nr:hypothetical protein [Tanacetum cinerariifolium]
METKNSDIDTLTNFMNYVLVVVAGTSSTNISGTKDVASQAVKKDVPSLRYISLPNWFHEAYMETRNSDGCNANDPENSGISNPTATSKVPSAKQVEPAVPLTVETEIPTVSSPVPTVCLDFSTESSSDLRIISKGDFSQKETPSLGNALTLSNRFEDSFGEEDLEFPDRVYNMEKVMYGLYQAPRAWSANTHMDKENPWGKDRPSKDMELHLYRSMIRSLMYLTTSRPDIMFVVCACARHQVTPKECHLHAVKRIFRYLKGHPKLGLWYLKECPFDLVAYSDSDYGGATQDRKSTRGCQFLGRRLISWQRKKQTIVATSKTEAEYVAAASGCGQVLRIQNQMLDYGIETTNLETNILATVDGKPMTISESSLRRHLKLNDEEGISSLPDTKLFENLSLMGYNILPNQRFTLQKGQFSHQWKFLIHTIMQCLSLKSTSFNEFSSNIVTAMDEGSATLTEPYHTPSPQEQHSPLLDPTSPSHLTTTTEPISQTPTVTPTETPTLRRYTKRAIRIAQSKALSPVADEPASLLRDDRQGEAFPTVSSLDAGHDRENINKTSALPHESSTRVTSLDVDEGNQDLEIFGLKAKVKFLKDKDRGSVEPTQEDAPIKGGIIEIGEEVGADKSTELGSNDTDEMVNVLSLMEAANILTSVPTISGLFSTASAIFTTASVVTPYTRRPRGISTKDKGKEKVVESERMNEPLARDSKIARLHAEEELKMMIQGLDRSNEVIAKHLQEYEQAAADLSIREKIELINELVKYQDHHTKILKYQAQQSKPLLKKEQREFYISSKKARTKIDQGSSKRIKTSKDVSEEDLKGMIQLVPLEEVYVEALECDREDLHQLWTLVKETLSIKQATKDKEKKLWVELKRLFEPDFEDQLWTHNQALMHDPLEWKLYDTCGVHHVFTKDQEIFMLYNRIPLLKHFATAEEFALLDEDKIYSQSKTRVS